MSDNVSGRGSCCWCCCSFIITSGLTVLFMWLSLRPSSPKCFIQEFYVPALNTTDQISNATRNGTAVNTTITFQLRLENVMKDKGVLYDDVNVTIFYGNSSRPIANHTVGRFRQGHHKRATKTELVQTHGVPWAEAYLAAARNDSHFRVGLATRVRFRIMFFNTKRQGLVVGANVTVNYSGHKDTKAKIRLKSAALPTPRSHPAWLALSILFYVLTLGW